MAVAGCNPAEQGLRSEGSPWGTGSRPCGDGVLCMTAMVGSHRCVSVDVLQHALASAAQCPLLRPLILFNTSQTLQKLLVYTLVCFPNTISSDALFTLLLGFLSSPLNLFPLLNSPRFSHLLSSSSPLVHSYILSTQNNLCN